MSRRLILTLAVLSLTVTVVAATSTRQAEAQRVPPALQADAEIAGMVVQCYTGGLVQMRVTASSLIEAADGGLMTIGRAGGSCVGVDDALASALAGSRCTFTVSPQEGFNAVCAGSRAEVVEALARVARAIHDLS